jgi:hypothetical protein
MSSVKSSWITRFSARRRARLLLGEKAIAELERAQWALGGRYPFTEPNSAKQSTLSAPSERLWPTAASYREL